MCIATYAPADTVTGAYTLHLAPGTYDLAASAASHGVAGAMTQVTVTLNPDDVISQDFSVTSPPEIATLTGTVTGPGGVVYQPPAQAGVDLCPSAGPCAVSFAPADTLTGAYTAYLPAGTYNLAATVALSGARGPAVTASVTLEPGDVVTQDFVVSLPAIATVSGTVKDPNGNPLAGSGVAACPSSVPLTPGCTGFRSAAADGTGHYSLVLDAASYSSYNLVGYMATSSGFVTSPPVQLAVSAGDALTQNFVVTPPVVNTPTHLTITGGTQGEVGDPVTVSAVLVAQTGAPVGVPLPGQWVEFTLGVSTCGATTDASGTASCSVTPLDTGAPLQLMASFSGAPAPPPPTTLGQLQPSNTMVSFTIVPEETVLTYSGPTTGTYGTDIQLLASLVTDDGYVVSGRSITLSFGTQSCPATTNKDGDASCILNLQQSPGPVTASATFDGDSSYQGSSSSSGASVEPAAPTPAAPTIVSVTPANRALVVRWTPPVDNGAGRIKRFGISCSSPSAPLRTILTMGVAVPGSNDRQATVTSMVAGAGYECTVFARNAFGDGPPSAPMAATADAVPGAPGLALTAGDGSFTVQLSPPTLTGPSPAVSYRLTCGVVGGPSGGVVNGLVIPVESAGPIVFVGLTNGQAYVCTAAATNAIGTGPVRTRTVTPRTTPDAPANVVWAGSMSSMTVTWDAPPSTGGAPIKGYTITCSGIGVVVTKSVSSTTRSLVFRLPTSGAPYVCSIAARNVAGTGSGSPPTPIGA